ncbi:MAG: ABC transporter substrate-binding protein [Nitrospirae bacterium]|nr:ABC transporter substrate-binding protein [Nitrospirota bacterium]
MKRGTAIISIVILSVLFIAAVEAQAVEKTVGIIMTGDIPYYKTIHKAFLEGLSAEGLGAGKVNVVVQAPAPDTMAWMNAARKLVAVDVNIIVAYGAPAALAVIHESSDIPVVFAGVYDPQAVGIIGKNATGISSKVPVASVVKNLKGMSNFSKLGIVFNDSERDTVKQAEEVKQFEGQYGFQSVRFNIKRFGDAAKISNVDALFITTSCSAMQCVDNVVGVARKGKIPTATTIGGGEERGIILTLTADPNEQGREAAERVSKILKGAKPASIPIEIPKKIEMIINLKEATAIDLKVPFDILTSATRIIK